MNDQDPEQSKLNTRKYDAESTQALYKVAGEYLGYGNHCKSLYNNVCPHLIEAIKPLGKMAPGGADIYMNIYECSLFKARLLQEQLDFYPWNCIPIRCDKCKENLNDT